MTVKEFKKLVRELPKEYNDHELYVQCEDGKHEWYYVLQFYKEKGNAVTLLIEEDYSN